MDWKKTVSDSLKAMAVNADVKMTDDSVVISHNAADDIFKLMSEMDDIDYSEIEKARKEYRHPVHGKIVGTFMSAYYDGDIYEDGHHENVFYHGD